MYPRNAASPERIAVGSVILIADGTPQSTGVSIAVIPQGGASAAGGGTTAYDNGMVLYTPTQAETNYTSFVVIAYKASCLPSSITVVTSASATAGKVVLSGETHTSAVIPTVTTLTGHTAQTGDSYARLGAPAGASVSADIAAAKSDTGAIKTKTDFLPSATAGATGGVFIAGTNAATTITTALTANITGNLSGSVDSVTNAVGSVTAGVTVTTNNDKTGYTLSSAGIQAVWDALTSALTTVGSIGKRLADYITGDAYARLGAPTGASVSVDIAAVKADTAAILIDTAEIGAAGAGLTAVASAADLATVAGYIDTEVAAIKAKTDNLPASPASVSDIPTAAAVADAVWDEDIVAAHTTADTAGVKLAAAGGAADPWSTALPGAYGAGSAGYIMGTNLDAAVTSRMATYTQPTGFLAATFPTTVASTTNITAATGVVLSGVTHTGAVIPTVSTLTGHTPQTGDSFARLGAPAGASIAADVAAVAADAAAVLVDTGTTLPATLATLPGDVWDATLASHLTAGTTGFALNAAGAAGDPWSTAIPGAYGAGSAGYIVGTYVDAAISGVSGLDAAGVRAAIGLASANIDTQLGDLPTNAELATALGTADDAVLAVLGTPTGVSLAADIAAAKADTAAILTDTGTTLPATLSALATAASVATAQSDLDILTGTDGVTLATAQPNYAPNTTTPLDAAGIRSAVGLSSADLDTQLGVIAASADAADLRGSRTVIRGTAGVATTPSTTQFTPSAISPAGVAPDQFKGRILIWDNDTTTTALRGQATDITASAGASLPLLTFTALTTAPAAGDTFSIV